MVKFLKMQALGNDFVVIDKIDQQINLSMAQIKLICSRHYGVGCDQLLLIDKAKDNTAAFSLQIFNPDASESFQCGNGIRAVARYLAKYRTKQNPIPVITQSNHYELFLQADAQVRVNMQAPVFELDRIPFIEGDLPKLARNRYGIAGQDAMVLSVGNPHCVLFVDDVDHYPVASMGAQLTKHIAFPQQTNVEFCQVISRNHMKIRVYERGVGETLACGSGACASMVAARLRNFLDASATIQMLGGALTIEWEGDGNSVWMCGPAEFVFEGALTIEQV